MTTYKFKDLIGDGDVKVNYLNLKLHQWQENFRNLRATIPVFCLVSLIAGYLLGWMVYSGR